MLFKWKKFILYSFYYLLLNIDLFFYPHIGYHYINTSIALVIKSTKYFIVKFIAFYKYCATFLNNYTQHIWVFCNTTQSYMFFQIHLISLFGIQHFHINSNDRLTIITFYKLIAFLSEYKIWDILYFFK